MDFSTLHTIMIICSIIASVTTVTILISKKISSFKLEIMKLFTKLDDARQEHSKNILANQLDIKYRAETCEDRHRWSGEERRKSS
jgi:hypothetical protein